MESFTEQLIQAAKLKMPKLMQSSLINVLQEDSCDIDRRTKVICTIGPSCWSLEGLTELIVNGMDIARFNFSHGDHQLYADLFARLREALKQLGYRKKVGILLDTKGPEVRTGMLKNKKVQLKKDQSLILTTDYTYIGDENKIAVSYPDIVKTTSKGQKVLIADGNIECEVQEILSDTEIRIKVLNDFEIGERKNMNFPGQKVLLPTITEKDKLDIIFGAQQDVDFIALSFTRSKADIEECRKILGEKRDFIKIIAKIENMEGLEAFDEILEATDGVMVARGDLGMEIPPEKVFLAQKFLTNKCNELGKPCVVATQMLESMVKNPRPTRAEASDVANAVLDGADCVMLSGETAGGDFPFRALQIMTKICLEAEKCIDHRMMFRRVKDKALHYSPSSVIQRQQYQHMEASEAVCAAAVEAAMDMGVKAIFILTELGHIAHLISKYRPSMKILSGTPIPKIVNTLTMYRGVQPILIPEKIVQDSTQMSYIIEKAKSMGIVEPGDKVVAVHSVSENTSAQANLLQIITIDETEIAEVSTPISLKDTSSGNLFSFNE